ncbi:integumentary mucin C.1-like [Uloborus diversus]|uniref:integumentary mucin C.1-like n=1 Tax=Uloborus diversus TaxID=327109 RepID=UPI00240A3CAE|nr:integumentary mucin C.1-like [Uloborus diversus]
MDVTAFGVSTWQYHFWFEDRIHANWIIDTFDDFHMVTCLQKCRINENCTGLALGPLKEDLEDYARTCHLLSYVDDSECFENDECDKKEFQVYQLADLKRIPETTTATTTTTAATTTTTVATTTEAETTTEKTTTTPATTTTTTPATTTTTAATTSTTEPTTTTTEKTTTTTAMTTTTEAATTTSEATTTEKATTTTTSRPTTTTVADTTTTEEPTTTEQPTTTSAPTTTEAPTTTSKPTEPETVPAECRTPPGNIVCTEPKLQNIVYGLISKFPLFSDASMEVQCENPFTQDIFKRSTSERTAYKPFSGLFPCEDNQVMTGIEVCFEGDLKYIAVECTTVQDGFVVKRDDIKGDNNTPQQPEKTSCPDKMAMVSLKLEKDDEGKIAVYIQCAAIARK